MKPTATPPIARPSGFSLAIPTACRAPSFTSPDSGVAPETFERTESTLPEMASFARPVTSVLWPSASTVSPIRSRVSSMSCLIWLGS